MSNYAKAQPKNIDTPETTIVQQEELFSDELYFELMDNMQKRYQNKDMKTLNLRKNELLKLLRKKSKLDSKTQQRLEIEWIVINENINKFNMLSE